MPTRPNANGLLEAKKKQQRTRQLTMKLGHEI
jgi:hypothetical protein